MRVLSYNEMEANFIKAHPNYQHSVGQKLRFEEVWEGAAPHNPSAPVWLQVRQLEEKKLVMAVRFEPTKENMTSVIHFCEQSNTGDELLWRPIPISHARVLGGEDPFITSIHGDIVVAMKYALPVSSGFKGDVPCCTVLFRGKTLRSLRKCSVWDEVNCVRPIELRSGDIGVFTRTKKGAFGHSVIEWRVVKEIEDISPDSFERVKPTYLDVFAPEEWGSVNEPNLCSDDTIVAIGHVAAQVSRRKVKYAAMKFKFDPKTGKRSQLCIIATRKSFPSGRAKRQGLADVVYPAGTRSIDGRVMLYAGTGDAEVQQTDVSGCVDFG